MSEPKQANGPQVTCPSCGNLTRYSPKNAYRPFCSKRCKVLDLGAWASEQYRIAGNPQEQPPPEE